MLSLTATELSRFMACNGSRLMGGIPPISEDNAVRDEGNAAHWLIEQVFKGNGGLDEYIDRKAPNGIYITPDMVDYCFEYLSAITVIGGEVECDTSFSDGKSYCIRGRADHRALVGSTLYIDDFKYGWKIVSPEENWTLISHAVTAQNVEKVVFRIFQPRPYHPNGPIRTWVISWKDLYEKYITKLLSTLINPSDILYTGQHCYKCKSMSQCPAAQIALMNGVDVSETAYDNTVNNDTLSFLIEQSERAMSVLKENMEAYHELAKERIKQGQVVKGFSLQTDLGQKAWKENLTPELLFAMTGKDLRSKNLITPTQAKKLGVDVDALCEQRNKGVKLVRVDSTKVAEKLFGKKG